LGTDTNVDQLVQQCNIACSTSAVLDYCRDRSADFGDDPRGELTVNCRGLEFHNVGLSSCPISSNCYPRGAPETENFTIADNTELGKTKATCEGFQKVWRSQNKEIGDTVCESFKFDKANYFCCVAANSII